MNLKLIDNDNFSVTVMILSTSPLPVFSHADDSAREIILVESSAGMIVVNALSRSSMCNSLVAIPKHQFHGKIQRFFIFYLGRLSGP